MISNLFTPKIGEDSHFDSYFSMGLKPPTRNCFERLCPNTTAFSKGASATPDGRPTRKWGLKEGFAHVQSSPSIKRAKTIDEIIGGFIVF